MGRMRMAMAALLGAASLVVGGGAVASADQGESFFQFDSMTTVSGAALAPAVNDRGLIGGAKAWVITSGTGELDRDGHLHVSVVGLVIPVLNNTNPLTQFAAVVSCLTPRHGIVNLRTAPVPTGPAGNATIDTTVALPRGCHQPEVFVTSATGAWFARSNPEEEDED